MNPNYVKESPLGLVFTESFFENCLQKHFNDNTLKVMSAIYSPSESEKVALKLKNPPSRTHPIGIQRYEIAYDRQGQKQTIFLTTKSKISDQQYLAMLSGAFQKCGIEAKEPIINYLQKLEFANVNIKEIAIYNMQATQPVFRDFMPLAYGTYLSDDNQICILVMQCLDDSWLSMSASDISKWDQGATELFVKEISAMHAIWYKKESEIASLKGFENILNAEKMISMLAYWQSLAMAVKNANFPFLNEEDYQFHERIIADIPIWRSKIDSMDKTLVQNDCVPKNVALDTNDNKIYIYDWEIATLNVPQRDVIEFLCYVLPEDFDLSLLKYYIDLHYTCVMNKTQMHIDKIEWYEGFRVCVLDYLLQRVFPQLVFEKLEARNVKAVYGRARRMINLLSESD